MSTAPAIKPTLDKTPEATASETKTAERKIVLPPPLVDESNTSQPPSLSPPKENNTSEAPPATPSNSGSSSTASNPPANNSKPIPKKITSEDVSKWVNENVTQDVSNGLADILFNVINCVFSSPYKIISPIINYLITDKTKIKYILASWSLVGIITVVLCVVLKLISNSFNIVPWIIAVILDTIILMIFSGIIKAKISGIKNLKGVKVLNKYLNLYEEEPDTNVEESDSIESVPDEEELTGDLIVNSDEEELTLDDEPIESEIKFDDDLDFDLYEEVSDNSTELDFDISDSKDNVEGISDLEDAMNSVSSIVESIADSSFIDTNKIKADLPISSPFEDELSNALEVSNASFKDSIRNLANESMSANNQMVLNDINFAFSSAESEPKKTPPTRVRKFRGLMPVDDDNENI